MQTAKTVMKLRIENAAIQNPPGGGTQHTVNAKCHDSLSQV
jgi:hypothetical protein